MTSPARSTYVVCIDGTWNRPSNPDGDPIDEAIETASETNVHRIFRFLAGEGPGSSSRTTRVAQLKTDRRHPSPGAVFYATGVGTSGNWLTNTFAGATGFGTMKRILLAYQFLAERYRPGDEIFGFGFSRGAFAVRSLSGLLHHIGVPAVPRRIDELELDHIGAKYKARRITPPGIPGFRPASIRFLGVWDTVGSLAFQREDTSFHDLSPPNVNRVAHALALDELRRDFAPTYWAAGTGTTKVDETWFSGVHSNVGGGYESPQLSNIPLSWMVARAVAAGLPAEEAYISGWKNENQLGILRDSYREYMAPMWRLGHLFKGSPHPRLLQANQRIHRSVFDRIERVKSDYVTADEMDPIKWESYEPAAVADGDLQWADHRAAFKGRVVETEDYLDKNG